MSTKQETSFFCTLFNPVYIYIISSGLNITFIHVTLLLRQGSILVHFNPFDPETIYISISLKPKRLAIYLFYIQFLVQTTCSCPSFINVSSIFCDRSARARVETLLLWAFLISMAWWEGVDEIHLLIAPANYYWIPWPYVSFTFSTLPLKIKYSIEHIVIFEILFMVDLARGIWKKWYLIYWLDDGCNYRYWIWYVV